MGKHVQFRHRHLPIPRRRSSCLNFMHQPKAAWPTEDAAWAEARRLQPMAAYPLHPYPCEEGVHGWHVGTERQDEVRRAPYKPDYYSHRTPHRLDWLLIEIGERACVQMLAESSDSRRQRRVRVSARATSAAKRARHTASSVPFPQETQ